jgi:hypothetical protein
MINQKKERIETKSNTLKNCFIITCAILGSCTLFSPAMHFGLVTITLFSTDPHITNNMTYFALFCGVASVAATSILGFNSWSKILSLSYKTRSDTLKRALCYAGGVITSAPLMFDAFTVNQATIELTQNLIFTIFPGIFMSGVYGYSIEYLYDELKNSKIKPLSSINETQKSLALSFGFILGSISAIGCYWESLNSITPWLHASTLAYILSLLPVICRAPLFIVSVYNVALKLLFAANQKTIPTTNYLLLLISISLFSVFTVGGYSDITYNGMSQSAIYQSSSTFRHYFYPLVLSIAMFSMLILNIDALITAIHRLKNKPVHARETA